VFVGFFLALQKQDMLSGLISCNGKQGTVAASVVATESQTPGQASNAAAPTVDVTPSHTMEASMQRGQQSAVPLAEVPQASATEQVATPPQPTAKEQNNEVAADSQVVAKSAKASPQQQVADDPTPNVGVEYRCMDEPFKSERNCKQIRPGCKKIPSGPGKTNCPKDDVWLSKMVQADPHPRKIIVNIGCNTAIDSVKMLQYWDQKKFWSLQKWEKRSGPDFCRGSTTLARPPKVDSKEVPLAICVEAVPKTAQKVHTTAKQVGYSEDLGVGELRVVHAAASDFARPGETVSFADTLPGYEQAGIGGTNSNPFMLGKFKLVQVPKTTVDALVQDRPCPGSTC